MRIVYIVYPSDAIVFFEESMFYRQPQWMVSPRGEDVSPLLQWFPIVTALQVGIDMMFAAAVPPGHGHDYAVADYIEAWTAVTAPRIGPARMQAGSLPSWRPKRPGTADPGNTTVPSQRAAVDS